MGGDLRRRDSDKPKTLLEKLRSNVVAIAAIITASAAILIAPINFDSRYAHAGDLKALAETQAQQTSNLKASITQHQLNWLEYYNDRIRALERERDRFPNLRDTINRDIDDLKFRKQVLEKSLVDQSAKPIR